MLRNCVKIPKSNQRSIIAFKLETMSGINFDHQEINVIKIDEELNF